MGKKRKGHHPDFKFKVSLESFINNDVSGTARKYGVHPNVLSVWRSTLGKSGQIVFQKEKVDRQKHLEKKIESLETLIGQKEVELSLLKKYLDFYAPIDGD